MKKTTLSLTALAAIFFASCTKERTCSCATTYDGGSTEVTVTKARSTKQDAKTGAHPMKGLLIQTMVFMTGCRAPVNVVN